MPKLIPPIAEAEAASKSSNFWASHVDDKWSRLEVFGDAVHLPSSLRSITSLDSMSAIPDDPTVRTIGSRIIEAYQRSMATFDPRVAVWSSLFAPLTQSRDIPIGVRIYGFEDATPLRLLQNYDELCVRGEKRDALDKIFQQLRMWRSQRSWDRISALFAELEKRDPQVNLTLSMAVLSSTLIVKSESQLSAHRERFYNWLFSKIDETQGGKRASRLLDGLK